MSEPYVDFATIFQSKPSPGRVGAVFTVDGNYRWALPDPPEVVRVGDWLASNELNMKGRYTTTRYFGGFIVLFKESIDYMRFHDWFVQGNAESDQARWPDYEWLTPPKDEPILQIDPHKVFAGRNRRRTRYEQLPGGGDRAWSAPFHFDVIKKLYRHISTPFSTDKVNAPLLPIKAASLVKSAIQRG